MFRPGTENTLVNNTSCQYHLSRVVPFLKGDAIGDIRYVLAKDRVSFRWLTVPLAFILHEGGDAITLGRKINVSKGVIAIKTHSS